MSELEIVAARVPSDTITLFRDIVGEEHVLTGDAARAFRDPYWPEEWTGFDAAAVVQPGTTAEVRALVALADRHAIPLWVGSQGRNKGYGGGSPRVAGSIVVNMRRMNRIIDIDPEMGVAVVEPGVSFSQLSAALRDAGHQLMPAIPDFGSGSVIGNALDHGVLYGPDAADHMTPCGLEVVLADGSMLRTGMGALPDAPTWHLYRRGFGPSLDSLFMQSNFGIVVRMGVWLLPMPERFATVKVAAPRDGDLAALIDTLRVLRLDRTLEGVPRLYNTVAVAPLIGNRRDFWPGAGPISEPALEQMAAAFGTGRWMAHAGLWEDAAIMPLKLAKIRAAFGRIDGATVTVEECAPDQIAALPNPADRVIGGMPEESALDICHWGAKGVGAHTMNGLVVPMRGRDTMTLQAMARGIFEDAGFDHMAILTQISARSYIHVSSAVYDITDEDESRRAWAATRRLIAAGGEAGFGEYRAHLYNMDFAADRYSFGDHAMRRFVGAIKDAVDPKGILSPGKQSIWPRAYRDASGTPG